MGRLIDIENIDYVRLEDSLHCLEHHKGDEVECVICAPTVEAIPKTEVKKFLEEGTKNASNNVLAIVREDYIHKSEYENRLKADMVTMLTEIQLEIEEGSFYYIRIFGKPEDEKRVYLVELDDVNDIIQQKINVLKGENNGGR